MQIPTDLIAKKSIVEYPFNELATFEYPHLFELESGQTLPGLTLCYSTYGQLNHDKSNVVWVCHALTGNSNVLEWWDSLFGAGKIYDPSSYFIVCVNVIGSYYGSTNPLSINKKTGQPFFTAFPNITSKDLVKSFELILNFLGIQKIHTCIGGSLGGQHALEWAVSNPSLIENLVLVATNAKTSPWGIALNETQRMAIQADRTWGEPSAEAGLEGMKVARAIALLSYRSFETYQQTQEDELNALFAYRASSYQRYQGEKFSKRFSAYSYWSLSVTLDSHNVGRNRESVEQALSLVQAKTLLIGISSDLLFPVSEQQFISKHVSNCTLQIIDSLYGHDGFLIESEKMEAIIRNFYQS